jgi:hypothetical protein
VALSRRLPFALSEFSAVNSLRFPSIPS